MTLAATLWLIAPGAALILLLALVLTARPDPARAIHAAPERPLRDHRARRGRRRRGTPI